jgi:hypothetical protein
MDDWKKKKVGLYLRRSKGESGSTSEQLKRIKKVVKALEKDGKISKVDWRVVGKAIDKEYTFKASRDLALKGDVFNEGEGASASELESIRDRKVMKEMIRRMVAGEYDVIIAESLDRFSRDPLSFGWGYLPIWREQGKIFWGLSDNRGYGTLEPQNESIITTQLMWGGEGKKQESKKAIGSLERKIDVGYISKPKAELLGSGTKGAGMNYRDAWAEMQEVGENANGRLNTPTIVGKKFRKDHTWASNFYQMFKQWEELDVLEDWFNAVEAINQYIENYPMVNGHSWKQDKVRQLVKSSNGFLAYPAGVNPSIKYPQGKFEFITFPNPTDFDLEELAITKDPNLIRGWRVKREPLANKKLLKFQTQFRGKGGAGKKLI